MTKGETLKLLVSDGSAASVEFKFGGAQTRAIAATKNGTDFTISASTVDWMAGLYVWQAWATYPDATKAIIATGNVDLDDALAVGDVRSVARKNVEAIEAMLSNNAGEGVRRYRINNRELERYSVSELMQLLSYWRERMKREERVAAGRSSLGPRISVRF
jgi:hypothetical protein